ncbi:hypothetical protein CEXT_624381 [Caerostris extrusa]|uniref:Uncharacterized protein n=1 Tax=Caerostris extrusa TaxID=172846 RepID=A0AAV4TIL3_CAEEX|nr:hypothetical protein CEXT_624381 [Caerostris extrusa]
MVNLQVQEIYGNEYLNGKPSRLTEKRYIMAEDTSFSDFHRFMAAEQKNLHARKTLFDKASTRNSWLQILLAEKRNGSLSAVNHHAS